MSSEALRLAQALDNHQAVEEDAADMLRTQAASIASLEAERDQLRAEVERLREFFDADMAVAKVYDEVSPGLTSPKGAEWSDRVEAAIARRCAAVIAIEAAKDAP